MTQFDEVSAPLEVRHAPAGPAVNPEAVTARTSRGPAAILQLQRSAGNAAVVAQLAEDDGHESNTTRPITDVVSGGGSPLDRSTKGSMERAFGQDFSDVRIHDDAAATAAAHDVSAKAATVGNHIVFRSGEFNPGSAQGQHLLAHELTHVVQQRSGPVDGTSAGGGVKVSDPGDRFELAAEDNAHRISSQLSADPALAGASSTSASGGSVQREEAVQREEGEEEDVQTMADASLQREEEDEGESEA